MNGGGSMTIANGATLTIGGSGQHLLDGRALNNSGQATWSGDGLTLANGATLPNQDGGTFEISSGGTLGAASSPRASGPSAAPAASKLVNQGTLRKTGSANTHIEVAVENSGQVTIEGGTLDFDGGFTQSEGATIGEVPIILMFFATFPAKTP